MKFGKTFHFTIIFLTSVIFILFAGVSSVSAEKPLYFVGVENVIPSAYAENGEIKGIEYDTFREIASRLGLNVKIELLPVKRMLAYMEEGEADGAFQIYYAKERERFALYSDIPMRTFSMNVYVKKDKTFEFGEVKDLYGKKVGKQSGFFISPDFEQAVKEGKIILDEAQNNEMNLKKLILGRIDCYISTSVMSKIYIEKLGLQNDILKLPTPIVAEKSIYLALSKNGKNIPDKESLMKKINQVLKTIHEDGTSEKIRNKYFQP